MAGDSGSEKFNHFFPQVDLQIVSLWSCASPVGLPLMRGQLSICEGAGC